MIVLVSLLLWTAETDPVAIVRQSIQANAANRAKARNYSYREYKVNRQFASDGKEKEVHSRTWDIIGLEGSTYRKLILLDDKPLAPKIQKAEDERLSKEAERRKRETPEQRRSRFFQTSYHFSIPYARIPDIYDLRFLHEDALANLAVYVVACRPKPSAVPKTPDEKEALNYNMVLSIDQREFVPLKMELEVVGEHSWLHKGSTATLTLEKVNDEVWMPKETEFRFEATVIKMVKVRGGSTTTFSQFQKFQSSSEFITGDDGPR